MRKFFEIGGLFAAVVLIAFGIGALVLGVNGRSTVRDSLKLEQIVGSDDMTPALIAADAKKAGLPDSLKTPTVDIAGKPIDTGDRARAFASYMRIHTLEATGGLTYAQMGRFATADGAAKGTNDPAAAQKGPDGEPVANGARNIWVTETALTTALNTSYMAERTRDLRDRRRNRSAALGLRLRDPRNRWCSPERGSHRHLREARPEARQDSNSPGGVTPAHLTHRRGPSFGAARAVVDLRDS